MKKENRQKHKKLTKSNRTWVQVKKFDYKTKRSLEPAGSLIPLMTGKAASWKAMGDVARTAAEGNWFKILTVHG